MGVPPVPTWDGLHPLIIHFPIALLLAAPILIILGALLWRRAGREFLICGLLLMILRTVSAYVAVETGEAAGKLAERTPEINAVLERHQRLAETTRLAFSVLTIIYAALVFLPGLLRHQSRTFTQVLPLVFLFVYAAAALLLANTAHNGGRLVHELGIKAITAPERLTTALPR